MIKSLWTYVLISNALIIWKDQSILFSRIVTISLFLVSFLAYNKFSVLPLNDSIALDSLIFSHLVNTFLVFLIFWLFSFSFLRLFWLEFYKTLSALYNIISYYKLTSFIFIVHYFCSICVVLINADMCSVLLLFIYLACLLILVYLLFVNTTLLNNHPYLYFFLIIICLFIVVSSFIYFTIYIVKFVLSILKKISDNIYNVKTQTNESTSSNSSNNTSNNNNQNNKPPKGPNNIYTTSDEKKK